MSKKTLKVMIELAIVIALVFGFNIINRLIVENRKKTFIPISDSSNYAYQVEEVELEGNHLIIKGWFFELRKVANVKRDVADGKQLGIVLYDINSGIEENTEGKEIFREGVLAKVSRCDRQDVNAYFECEYDYTHCGFIAEVDVNDIDISNGEYQIIFKPEDEEKYGIVTDGNAYIDRGSISYIDPRDKIVLEVENTDLEEIVTQGVCVASCPEFDICIYQYGWKLYWIAGTKYHFEEDGSTFIQYNLKTTQFDRLPKEWIDNGRYWSDIGDMFEYYEVTDNMRCGKYRVSVRNIPDEYSVVRGCTGYYIENKYVWNRFFRPIYSFKID